MNKYKGEILLIFSSVLFAITAVFVKLSSAYFNGIFITSVRFVIGIILTIVIMKLLKIKFVIENLKDWILRGVFGSVAMVCFYLSISITSSGRAIMLCDTYPMFVALFGFIFFREKIFLNNIISLLFCLVGIVFIFYDRGTYNIIGDVLGLISGISSGMAIHYVRRSATNNHPSIVYLAACIIGLVFVPFSFSGKTDFNLISIILVITVGFFTFFAQYVMSFGYKYVTATKGSIIGYFQIPLTTFLSIIVLNETFRIKFIIGTVMIILGLLVNSFLKIKKINQNI
ncbi:MAG TPA: DMT family transporter [Spirochaetota bacterium]|nr:DMT family transporter [Spirochaetota bacterium]